MSCLATHGKATMTIAESLKGRLVLILDDEYLPAVEVAEMVRLLGGAVQGPVARPDAARRLIDLQRPDGAVLDVKLAGETSLALADDLTDRGVPVIFATGYERFILPDRFTDTPRLSKPVDIAALEQAAERLFNH